ncbi:MAG: tRNA glutamyl-Q(34) synthetase GluQRS [Pseudomonadales bacterium]|nr:tRNA glutamyl-Q(34) synthetase GluQRS [Pseudomonadales bacterium]
MRSKKNNGEPDPPYIGRFAPSPTGELHFGSLLAALASYLDAKHHRGLWLLRMEDLDPEREPTGAASSILQALEKFGLHWDGPVLYQSTRLEAYQSVLDELTAAGMIYPCSCSRKRVRALGGIYDGHCRFHCPKPGPHAMRVYVGTANPGFTDLIQGPFSQNLAASSGDFIVRRRDGLFAYQLAVVIDDHYQEINHIVRGADLLESTPRQIYLQQLLSAPCPVYAHIPIATNALNQKLSKQHFAEVLDLAQAPRQLNQALCFLGQKPPAGSEQETVEQQLQWAVRNWDIQRVPKLATIRI